MRTQPGPAGTPMPLKTQSCKGKGRRLQQAVARDIIAAFDHLQEDDVRSTSMGAGEDVQLSPAARAAMPYSIECKNTERLNLWGALERCKGNAPAGATPLVVFGATDPIRTPWCRGRTWCGCAAVRAAGRRRRHRRPPPPAPRRDVLGIGYSGELPKVVVRPRIHPGRSCPPVPPRTLRAEEW